MGSKDGTGSCYSNDSNVKLINDILNAIWYQEHYLFMKFLESKETIKTKSFEKLVD